MTKEQKQIYKWLLSKSSYLKKSASWLFIANIGSPNGSMQDYEIALKQARKDHKKPKEDLSYGVKEYYSAPIRGEAGKLFKDTVWGKKLQAVNKPKVDIIRNINYDYDPNNILAIADMHEPFCKKGYLEHCIKIRDKYRCGTIVLIGDEVDLCGVSQWEKDPDGFSAGTEAEQAQNKMKLWYKAFPTAFVCIGNHTARPFRMAKQNGIPKKFIKSYEEAWEAPSTWKWSESWEFNNTLFTHGTGFSGPNAAIRIATRHRQNTVIGHIHSEAGIQYSASKIDLVWGMQLGGALDDTSYASYYAKDQLKKSIIGCGVIINNLPIYEPMLL